MIVNVVVGLISESTIEDNFLWELSPQLAKQLLEGLPY
jgi:hypothetical protein